jgi:hypothetical protein
MLAWDFKKDEDRSSKVTEHRARVGILSAGWGTWESSIKDCNEAVAREWL